MRKSTIDGIMQRESSLAESDFDPPFIRNAPRSLELNSLH